MNIEAIRLSFMPSDVRLLFIGESPPASGKFFYVESAMTTYTARAFEAAHGREFSDTEDFLRYFQSCGCYLDDLSHKPVDDLPSGEREQHLSESLGQLSQRIAELNPDIVVVVLKKIEKHVRQAVMKSGYCPKILVLPFPGFGYQNEYIEELVPILKQYVPAK